MIKHYLDLFLHSFYTLSFIRISILILFVISLFAIAVGIIVLLLEPIPRDHSLKRNKSSSIVDLLIIKFTETKYTVSIYNMIAQGTKLSASKYIKYIFILIGGILPVNIYSKVELTSGMIKKSSMILSSTDKKQVTHVARSVYGLLNNVYTDIATENIKESHTDIIKNTIEYMQNPDYGNTLIKGNILSSFFSKRIQVKSIQDAYKTLHPKSNVNFTTENIDKKPLYVPSRFFTELAVLHNHSRIHADNVSQVILTGDSIPASSKSNPFPDAFLDLRSQYGARRIFTDVKSGNGMTKEPLKGTIGQLTYEGDTQIYIPNNEVDLRQFNKDRLTMLQKRKDEILLNSNMNDSEKETFKLHLEECSIILNSKYQSVVDMHNKLEKTLYIIQSLPRFNKGISFINIVHIQTNTPMPDRELKFIQEVITHVDSKIFSNPRLLNRFLKEALNAYRKIDPTIVDKLKRLQDTEWSITDDIFNIDKTLFT
jgi:hypothetical protein